MAVVDKSKVLGTIIGTAIGDALGMPVETFTPKKIVEKYPQTNGLVTEYLVPDGHKWFDGRDAGTWTDDTQMTLAVIDGLIGVESFDDIDAVIERQAATHVKALKDAPMGWSKRTQNTIRELGNGRSWREPKKVPGTGNGVAMKMSPFGLLYAILWKETKNLDNVVYSFSHMSHGTEIAAESAAAQLRAVDVCYCDSGECSDFEFAAKFVNEITTGSSSFVHHPLMDELGTIDSEDSLTDRLFSLYNYDDLDLDKCIELFDGGTCYCYNSLPFAYAFFLRNPNNIQALYDVVSAGGDTDTNGAIVGALLGAKNGIEIFPQYLIDGLDQSELILEKAEQFYAYLTGLCL